MGEIYQYALSHAPSTMNASVKLLLRNQDENHRQKKLTKKAIQEELRKVMWSNLMSNK